MNAAVLLVDDDQDFLDIMKAKLTRAGFKRVRTECDPIEAAARFENGDTIDAVLIDMNMPDMDGIALLEIVKTLSPGTECIMVTAVNEARVAVECLHKGAYDYLLKPVSQEDLAFTLRRALERKRLLDILDIEKGNVQPRLINRKPFEPIITRSRKMLRVLKEAELHADSEVPVLITGESGTGKELLARAIHAASPRSAAVFTPVNMASVADGLFEAEFFGHTKGAFTGAEKERGGYLKHTHRGTLFLDEIGNLPTQLQGKLLRVLQDGEYTRLGASRSQKVDVRVIAATNEDLERLMAEKKFRKDLYYRIRGGWLHLPALREREEDIPLLAETFLNEYCADQQNNCHIEEEAFCLLMAYDFPGNIRELRSIVQSAANLARGRPIDAACLPRNLRRGRAVNACRKRSGAETPAPLAQVEKQHILEVYDHTGKNKSRSARILGIGLNTLRRRLASYGVG